MERSCWLNEMGLKRNGNNVYTILPTSAAVEGFYKRQLASGGRPPKHGAAVGEAQGSPAGAPTKAVLSLRGERRRNGTSEPCRLRRGEGCGVCADEGQA